MSVKITNEQIDAIFGESPFVARRKIDKSGYEVVEQTNEDWREVIGTDDDFKHWCDFTTFEEAQVIQRRFHVRWVLGVAGVSEGD